MVSDKEHRRRELKTARRCPQIDLQPYEVVSEGCVVASKQVKLKNIFAGRPLVPSAIETERRRRYYDLWYTKKFNQKCAVGESGLLVGRDNGRAYGVSNFTSHAATDPLLTDPLGQEWETFRSAAFA